MYLEILNAEITSNFKFQTSKSETYKRVWDKILQNEADGLQILSVSQDEHIQVCFVTKYTN